MTELVWEDTADWNTFKGSAQSGGTAQAWWETNLHLRSYYGFRAINRVCRNDAVAFDQVADFERHVAERFRGPDRETRRFVLTVAGSDPNSLANRLCGGQMVGQNCFKRRHGKDNKPPFLVGWSERVLCRAAFGF